MADLHLTNRYPVLEVNIGSGLKEMDPALAIPCRKSDCPCHHNILVLGYSNSPTSHFSCFPHEPEQG